MKILQLLLIAFTLLTGCTKKLLTSSIKTDTVVTDKTMTNYLALGDSYTIGESVPQGQSFPYQLYSALTGLGLSIQEPAIIATTGWTTDDLISGISHSGITDQKFGLVTLLIGVNDQYQQLSQTNYKVKFAEVLNTAIKFANGNTNRVFVISIPDYGVTPFANRQESTIGPQIDQFNAINKALSIQAGVHYVDITDISRQAGANTSLIAPDGLHPSGQMYQLWVKLLAPLVDVTLKNSHT